MADTKTLREALLLCEWIAENPHKRGSINGMAAQVRYAIESALAAQAKIDHLLLQSLRHAEWQDKHIHPVNGETYQAWKVSVYLPVPLSATDKSPEAALRRALQGVGLAAQAQDEPLLAEIKRLKRELSITRDSAEKNAALVDASILLADANDGIIARLRGQIAALKDAKAEPLLPRGCLLHWPAPGGGRRVVWSETRSAGDAIGCPVEPVYSAGIVPLHSAGAEKEANGRPIDAAAELLAAAQKALDECCDLAETDAGRALESAIAKVIGETQ